MNNVSDEQKEIQQVIEKNLPKHVGDVLQKRLSQADLDAEALKKANEQIKSLHETLNQTQNLLRDATAKISAYDAKSHELTRREKEVEKLEMDKKLIEMRAANAEQRVADHKEMMNTVFRVATIRESVYTTTKENENADTYSPNNKHRSKTVNVTRDKTAE